MHGEIQYLVSLQLDGCAIKGCHHDPDARSSSLLFDQHSMLRGSFKEHWSLDRYIAEPPQQGTVEVTIGVSLT